MIGVLHGITILNILIYIYKLRIQVTSARSLNSAASYVSHNYPKPPEKRTLLFEVAGTMKL